MSEPRIDSVVATGVAHAHRFTAGNRIRVELTNIDVTNRLQLGTYPFVLPMFATTGVTIRMDAAHPSFLEIPLETPPTGVAASGSELPSAFTLAQNYPNPFNSTTTIAFALSRSARVRLEVFDLLGRRVAVPLDLTLLPGEYRIPWDADDASSGVYLYRLSADAERRDGKMLLLR